MTKEFKVVTNCMEEKPDCFHASLRWRKLCESSLSFAVSLSLPRQSPRIEPSMSIDMVSMIFMSTIILSLGSGSTTSIG